MKLTVIMVVLNEAPFIHTALSAIYPFADRIFIQTGYDRSWNNQPVEPDGTVEKILAFPDPDGKIALLVRRMPDEAIARNLLMRMDGYALDHRHNNTLGLNAQVQEFCEGADYYWVIDGDEIYDPRTVERMLAYVRKRKPRLLYVRGLSYFRSWNYVVDPSDEFYQIGFMRNDFLFRENRNVDVFNWVRPLFNKYVKLPHPKQLELKLRVLMGQTRMPEEIGVFHHGGYVGDDLRIHKKISMSVHYYESKVFEWYRDVWQRWTPEMKNIHPFYPTAFPGVRHVATADLPPILREQPWPSGYIER